MLYTMKDAAAFCGLGVQTFRYHMDLGLIPRPTVKVGSRCVYREEDLPPIVEYFRSRNRYDRIEK